MANSSSSVANATFTVGSSYSIAVTGFTYIKDYAVIKGSCNSVSVSVIIGDKKSFPMSDMFMLKDSGGIKAIFKGIKNINGVDYRQFQLEEILF
jgi:hypothetical protein